MSIDPTAMDYADDTFIRSMRALNSMELADLPPGRAAPGSMREST